MIRFCFWNFPFWRECYARNDVCNACGNANRWLYFGRNGIGLPFSRVRFWIWFYNDASKVYFYFRKPMDIGGFSGFDFSKFEIWWCYDQEEDVDVFSVLSWTCCCQATYEQAPKRTMLFVLKGSSDLQMILCLLCDEGFRSPFRNFESKKQFTILFKCFYYLTKVLVQCL